MDITEELVAPYIEAVARALKAKYTIDDPMIDAYDDIVRTVLIGIPDAYTDDHERQGLALMWEPGHGWDAGIISHGPAATARVSMHTDLYLGYVPEPGVIVRAVGLMVSDGSLTAGRIVPTEAEMLAAYATKPEPESQG